METRIDTSHGTEIPRKSRSLDLKSLYKSRITEEDKKKGLKRKANEDGGDGNRDKKKKKKKSIKEVSLSSLKNVNSDSRKSLDVVVYDSDLVSGSHDSKDLKLSSNQTLNGSHGVNSVSSLSLEDNVIQIPRRKRGLVGRKKFEGGQLLKHQVQSSSKLDPVDQISKLSGESDDASGTHAESWKAKQEKDFDDLKENRNGESNSSRHSVKEEEDGQPSHLVVKNSDLSLKKSRRRRSKRKDLAPDGKGHVKEVESLVDKSIKRYNDAQDDEANLEENAAMMLSSRFDPSCTGFSSNSKASALQSASQSPLHLSSGPEFVGCGHGSKSVSGSESPSFDAAGMVLRPRKEGEEKRHPRKRRHFYEIFLADVDSHWVLNRRIKVFWPLDQSWYYGLVNDYDDEKKLHHVKYDDRDEEWINLENERFKLLLLPSEAPGKARRRKSKVQGENSDERTRKLKHKKEKEKKDLPVGDDNCIGSFMDSEPIISWLARSTHRVKSPKSPIRAVKKQKTSGLSTKSMQPLLSDDAVNLNGSFKGDPLSRAKRKVSRNSDLTERHAGDATQESSASESVPCPKESKMPIVYYRRRFRKTGSELSHTCQENNVCRSMLGSVTSASIADDIVNLKKRDVFLGKMNPDEPLWSVDDAGLLKLTLPCIESGKCKFIVNFPVDSVLFDSCGVGNFWLLNAAMLLHYGTVTITWPMVHLEMLFVDNVAGLRFLLFEGCLKQVLGFVFLALTMFHQRTEQGKFVELQLPVTSVRFKLTCFQHLRKQLVFTFYNFSEVKNSNWMDLDCKLRRHCLLTKQLPLSECTYDNIQMLQNGINPSPVTQPSLLKGRQRRSRQGISVMGVSRESAFLNISHASDENCNKVPPLALSFTAAPTFFLSLHLKMLMEKCLANFSFRDHDSVEHLEISECTMADEDSIMEDCSNKGLETTLEENLKVPSSEVASGGCFSSAKYELSTAPERNGYHVNGVSGDVTVPGTSVDSGVAADAIVQLPELRVHNSVSDQCALSSRELNDKDKPDTGSQSFLNDLCIEIPPFNQFEKPVDVHGAQQSTDPAWNTNGGIFPSPNPTAPRSTWHRNRNSSSVGHHSNGWSDGKSELLCNNFGNGPRKPRTQVSYSLPLGGFDLSLKQKVVHKGIASKRIRKANEKRSSDVARGSKKNLELLSCDVNILITAGDRGWRECGAQVMLELLDHNEWKLAVKISGITKYSYKAHQFLQPGSTNRYTHAMMWKGGKDWILEFPDRSQWALFKEMHEECHNRNIRAASMKNIPIPGVRSIEESDDIGMEMPFIRSCSKYFRQLETDVEMALDPGRVLYDMDSDDEEWILRIQNSSESNSCSGYISEEMFEKAMDMFEKAAYAQQRDDFTSDEIEELMAGVGPLDVTKVIYEHWRQKREKHGMPLIRHLQPPSWERYHQQVREWELTTNKNNTNLSNGSQDKPASVEKPPMFAFCLKPRGLEVPNRGSKQRSHRKVSIAGHSNATYADQDGFHSFGRRLNGYPFGDHAYESLDDSPLPLISPRTFSPRDGTSMSMSNDGFNRHHLRKLHRSKSKKYGNTASLNNPHMMAAFAPRTVGNRNGHHPSNASFSDWQARQQLQLEASPRHVMEQLSGPALDEYRVREASRAVKRAAKVAKLKRAKAERLSYIADEAIHKATAALMNAEAIKASAGDSNGNDDRQI
ncbi:hypothetical protein UlMin_035436 [Ulmus minor]